MLFTLLQKLQAKLSHLHPSTMVSIDYHSSGIPLLSIMPSPDRNDIELSWLIVVCLGAGWGALRQLWVDGNCNG